MSLNSLTAAPAQNKKVLSDNPKLRTQIKKCNAMNPPKCPLDSGNPDLVKQQCGVIYDSVEFNVGGAKR